MLRYHQEKFDPTLLDEKNINRIAVEQVPLDSFVLDMGCATGFIGEYLIKNKNCQVIGVELDEEEATLAKKRLSGVVITDLESYDAFSQIKKAARNKNFDIILATSVIEHLKDPNTFLLNIKKVIKPDGKIIISTPNIAHWTIVKSLLKGDFNYEEYGILDRTHVRFFTPKSFRKLFEENGFKVEDVQVDYVGGGYPKISSFLYRLFPNLFAYQVLITAKVK